MIIHNFNPVLIDLGLIQVRWYSLAYILGILLGWLYSIKIIKRNKHDSAQIEKSHFDDLLVYLVIGIIFGGRLGYVIFYNFEYYAHNFFEIFKVWEGGMSFHGGLLGVIISTVVYSKKTKTNFFRFTDIISCAAPIGIFLGRVANFINGELYGKISTVSWAVVFPNGGNVARHPSQIYEALLEGLLLFVIINYLAFKKQLIFKSGYISCLFLILYSVFRIISELFREADMHIGYVFNNFSLGTVLSFFTFIIGTLMISIIKKNEQNN
jgi:phosphatidylglycerol---prolipoprotein diacylglyceryl transferase